MLGGQHRGKERDQTGPRKCRGQVGGAAAVIAADAAADELTEPDQRDAKAGGADDAPERGDDAVFDAVLHKEHAGERQR